MRPLTPVLGGLLLALVTLAWGSAANAQPACRIDLVQQLSAQRPGTDDQIESLLSACGGSAASDYRVTFFGGLVARDRGDLRTAASLLERAHVLAPDIPFTGLELAVTDEWLGRLDAARTLYAQALAADRASDAALLGLGRVALAQYRLADARAAFDAVLARRPDDVDALNGLARVQLTDRRFNEARAGFERVLALDPHNAAATAGLADLAVAWNEQIDLAAGYTHTPMGNAWTAIGAASIKTSAVDRIDVGALSNSNELPAPALVDQRILPSEDAGIGLERDVPTNYAWSVAFDDRFYSGLPNEYWLQIAGSRQIADGVRVFANYRQQFGAEEWTGYLASAGFVVPIGHAWEVRPAGYISEFRQQFTPTEFAGLQSAGAVSLDLDRQIPGFAFFDAGAGYNPSISNLELHANAVVPVALRTAITVSIRYVSISHETQTLLGVRFYGQ